MQFFGAVRTISSLLEYCRIATKIKGVNYNALKFEANLIVYYFLLSAIISSALSRTVVSSRTTHPPFGPGSMWKPTAEPFL